MNPVYVSQTINDFNHAWGATCAEIYCRIWKEPPWNENFWNPADVLEDLRRQLAEPLSVCWLSLSQNCRVTGFSWGHGVNRDTMRAISGNEELDDFFKQPNPVFYVSELGVDPNERLKGVGRTLTAKLIAHSKNCGCKYVLLRTDVRAIPARALYSSMGFTELQSRDSIHEMRTYWSLTI